MDEAHGSLSLTTRKTRARITVPLSADLRAFLKAAPAPPKIRPEAAPLFPEAWRIVKESGKVSTLSLQFTNILAAVGLRVPLVLRRGPVGNPRLTPDFLEQGLLERGCGWQGAPQ